MSATMRTIGGMQFLVPDDVDEVRLFEECSAAMYGWARGPNDRRGATIHATQLASELAAVVESVQLPYKLHVPVSPVDKAPGETDAEFKKRCAVMFGIHCGPSEYSPVAIEPKRPIEAGTAVGIDENWNLVRMRDGAVAVGHVRDIEIASTIAQTITYGGYVKDPGESFVTSAKVVHAPPAEEVLTSARHLISTWNKPAPSREDERRAIDSMLREDARKTPAFAVARKAAVLAYAEHDPGMGTHEARTVLLQCGEYEALRGGMTRPSERALEYSDDRFMALSCALVAYERARAKS
jgi:hypothetical protein